MPKPAKLVQAKKPSAFEEFRKAHWNFKKTFTQNTRYISNLWNEYKQRETLRTLNETNSIPRQVNKEISEY